MLSARSCGMRGGMANRAARRGKVRLYEMKPEKSRRRIILIRLPNWYALIRFAQKFRERCRSFEEELRRMGSLIIHCADRTSVPAGSPCGR